MARGIHADVNRLDASRLQEMHLHLWNDSPSCLPVHPL